MWGFSTKLVPKCPNADQKLQRCHSCEKHLEFFRPDPNDFLSGAIADHGKKPSYISMTRRQSNNRWNGGISSHLAHKKNQSAKIRWKSSRLDFLRSRRHPYHWLSSEGPNNHRGVLLILTVAFNGHFEGKTSREVQITNKDKIYQKGQNYQKSFLMELVYLWYILVVLAAECTMFAVRYYCHITFKSWCT